jgi:hypothetical protein
LPPGLCRQSAHPVNAAGVQIGRSLFLWNLISVGKPIGTRRPVKMSFRLDPDVVIQRARRDGLAAIAGQVRQGLAAPLAKRSSEASCNRKIIADRQFLARSQRNAAALTTALVA